MSADAQGTKVVEERKTTTTEETGSASASHLGDRLLPENSKDNLDRKLDHAAEETFPGSDPVSVKITK